eukprot:675839-Hanusia_phi.AAC.2
MITSMFMKASSPYRRKDCNDNDDGVVHRTNEITEQATNRCELSKHEDRHVDEGYADGDQLGCWTESE